MTAVLALEEEHPATGALLDRDRRLFVRADPDQSWVGLRITAESVGPPRSIAMTLTPEQAEAVEQFLAKQRIAREAIDKETE